MDQYTPELLKDLEKFVMETVTKDPALKGTWEWSNREYKVGKFLGAVNYDYKLLLNLYSLGLKRKSGMKKVQPLNIAGGYLRR